LAVRSALLKWRRARQGRGEGLEMRRCVEEWTGREGGGEVRTGGGQRGRRGMATSCGRPNRGREADQWAAAIMPGGGTG
jgi:hypothetical protein